MPSPALRPCAGGCGQLVGRGRCRTCANRLEQQRGSSTDRGYGQTWIRFRHWWLGELVRQLHVPICGATLDGGPVTDDSRCKVQGIDTYANADGSSLHLDHEPPLRDDERPDTSKVCNRFRIQLLCASCHSAKTERERQDVTEVRDVVLRLSR